MNEKVILTWTVENWITVLLMVFLGTFFVKATYAFTMKAKGKAKEDG